MALYQENTENVTRVLQPYSGGNKTVNVLEDYAWTLSPKSARINVPYVYMKEYQQTTAQMLASLAYYYKQIVNSDNLDTLNTSVNNLTSSGVSGAIKTVVTGNYLKSSYKEPYKSRYIAEATGFSYIFPYVRDARVSRTNSFETSATLGLSGGLTNLGGKISEYLSAFTTAGQVGLMEVKSWKDTKFEEYTIEFDLLNTMSYDDIDKNRELIYLLTYQNSPSRRNFFITDPVVIYEMYIPDVVSLPVCHISQISVVNKGNTQQIGKKNIPEAYGITLTVESLLPPSRNIMNGVENINNRVQAISSITDITNEITTAINDAANKYVTKTLDSVSDASFKFNGGENTSNL